MPKNKPFAFLATQKPDDGRPTADFAIGNDEYIKKVIANWRLDPPAQAPPTEDTKDELEPDFTHESALTEALSRAVDFGLSQYELIMVASITPSLFEGIIAKENVLKPITEKAELIEDDDVAALYSLSEDQYFDLIRRREGLKQLIAGVAALPKATLMSIVATFDTIVVDIVTKMLRLGSDEWLLKSDKVLSVQNLVSAKSLDDLIDDAIKDEVYLFSRGSHDEQAKFIEKTFGVAIKGRWKRWPDYIEVFERRNLIAHGETTFNKRYVDICEAANHKGISKVLGEPVELTAMYLNQACDILLEFAILLPFSLWRKVSKDKEHDAFANLNEAAFKLINSEKYLPAARILEFALSLDKVSISQDTRQRLVVNRASALRHLKQLEKALQVLEEIDWSGSSDLFKLCVASVKVDADEVARLIPIVKGAGAIGARDFKEWPCLSFVKENEKVKVAFEKAFGEPLVAPESQDMANDDPIDLAGKGDLGTVH